MAKKTRKQTILENSLSIEDITKELNSYKTVKKYESMINEFENDRERIENIWDNQENQQKLTLDNEVKS